MAAAAREVFFVGTIPLMRELDVFRTLGELIGTRATRVPDGELGDRKLWVNSQYPVMIDCPALEPIEWPEGGLTRKTSYQLPLRIKKAAKDSDIKFTELGYARHAIASYLTFRGLKSEGKIPKNWRFQVNLPVPMDIMPQIVPADRARVEGPMQEAMLGELKRILDYIPHDELAITWDLVQGLLVFEKPDNDYVTLWFDNPLEAIVDRMAFLGRQVPGDVELGYHLCYGSQDHKLAMQPKDLSACVNLTNAIAAKLGRKIDYVHMPVPRERHDEMFFAPLKNIDRPRVGKVFLGLVHYTDGVEGARRRIESAEKYLDDFGIATQCGFGRRPTDQDILHLIKLHADIH